MVTVCLLTNHLKVAHHNNGRVPLNMVLLSSMAEVVDVADSVVVVVDMKLLSWALQFGWVLTMMIETIQLKRAMALHNIRFIRALQLHFLKPRIRVTRRKTFLNVRHLIPIPTTLTLNEAEET
jgi:hypothetical protein